MASPSSAPAMSEDSFSSLRLEVDRHRLLVCDTLPTVALVDQASVALLSPPLSRASSPLPPHLKVDIDIVSSPGVKVISRLPSPALNSETRQIGKKTSAFFSSPFDQDTSTLSPPPSLMRRNLTGSGTSPPSSFSSSNAPVVAEPGRSQTANSSFFFVKGSATPTPPPSVYSSVDDGPSSQRPPPKLPPLSRFFPSRATIDPGDSRRVCSSPPSIHTSPQRDFVTIDDLPSFSSSPTDLVTPDSPTPQSEISQPVENPQIDPLHCETAVPEAVELMQGTTIGTDVPLQLIRLLGQGAFSCVWLALDLEHRLEQPGVGSRLKSESIARKKGDRSMHGLRPPLPPSIAGNSLTRSQSIYFAARDGEGATSSDETEAKAEAKDNGDRNDDGGNLVAVKMMERAVCEANDRTRISFVREVEVLRHISHPSIVSYLHSFTTPTHHCLVLEALHGGELFDLLEQGDNHSRMTEPLLRRMFGELCQAVGWMHGVGLVHRDLKLENILLTANPFLTPVSSPITLSSLPSPLVKLTDFGLARFIDPADHALVTRCGSESYAAPEIVTGRPYDGRQTDAWACGIVLYALATRALPFDRVGSASDRDTRRSHLMRIAQGDYTWPEPEERLATEGLKDVVARLLVRNAAKRARVVELWDAPWMRGEGAPTPPLSKAGSPPTGRLVGSDIPSVAKQEL